MNFASRWRIELVLTRSGTLRKTGIAEHGFAFQQSEQNFGEMNLVRRDLKQVSVEDDQVGRFANFDRTGFGLFEVYIRAR